MRKNPVGTADGAAARRLDVALVYPPFGPAGIPSLGLALLAAGVKARGHRCRTFHWNLDLLSIMPGATVREQALAYHELSGRLWFPFNEWVFTDVVYGRPLPGDTETVSDLWLADRSAAGRRLTASDLLWLRSQAHDLVEAMAERLSGYEIVGIATTFFQNIAALGLAKVLKRHNPEQTVVLGGANCDGDMGPGLMTLFDFVDHAFAGEVDYVFPEFVDRLARRESTGDLPGLVTREAGSGLRASPPAIPVADLDSLPFPDFDDYIEERERVGLDGAFDRVLPLESSRGCWWGAKSHCTFCGLNALGMGYRQKGWQRFRDEVRKTVDRYQARFLFMTDNILSMRYFNEFMAWASGADLGVDFFYEIKANVDRRHVEKLSAAGVTAVQPGIESFSSEILALMGKGTTGIQNVALLKYARENAVLLSYNLLVGFPGERPEEYERMAAELPKLEHLRPPSGMPRVEFHRFSPYHSDPESFALTLRPSRKYRSIYPFPETAVQKIAYLFEAEEENEHDLDHVQPVLEAVERWRAGYRDDTCQLIWWPDGRDIVVEDHRPSFPPSRYRLSRYAAEVFRCLDAPTSIRRLLRQAEADADDSATDILSFVFSLSPRDADAAAEHVDFSARDFVKDPTGSLEPLLSRGLLYMEPNADPDRTRYLALPVSHDWRPSNPTWRAVGV